MLTDGFQLISFEETLKLRPISLELSCAFESRDRCIACDARLEPLVALIGHAGDSRMRVGVCVDCGYVGYMDFPNEKWLGDFYSGQWDRARVPFTELSATHVRALALIRGDEVSCRSKNALEIGCGYGAALRYLTARGFSRVVGIDPSRHRTEYARAHSGAECIVGNFGDSATWEALRVRSPYNVIFSHHVIEHVWDPEAFIASASLLQADGDRLILALPNILGEHSGYVLFYLPHPHSFSMQAIETLLSRYGYAITEDASPNTLHIIISAIKTKSSHARHAARHDYRALMRAKIRTGLALHGLSRFGRPASWHWNARDKGVGGDEAWIAARPRVQCPAFMHPLLRRFSPATHYSFTVAPLTRRYEPDIPYEIQYPGPIRLLIK